MLNFADKGVYSLVPKCKKKNSFSLSQIISKKRQTFILFNLVFFLRKKLSFSRKTFVYSHEIKCKLHSIFYLFYFLYNQLPMKIVFTSFYKIYYKENTKNHTPNF